MVGTMVLRGHLGLLDDVAVRYDDDLWPKSLACPCCGERLRALRADVEELMLGTDDGARGWTANCPSCDAALVAKGGGGALHLWTREAQEA